MAAKKKSKAKKSSSRRSAKSVETASPKIAQSATMNPSTFNMVAIALVAVVAILGYSRFKHLLVPATVNGSPVYSWQYVKSLHQTAGRQVLDQLVVEKLIEQEADNQNIVLTQDEIEAEFSRLEAQFESTGGLDAFLSGQGLTRKDIQKQLELNLKVQKIVIDGITVTDEEVEAYYQENRADIKTDDITEEEAMLNARAILSEQKLQQEIGVWVQDLRSQAQVTINFPESTTQ